MKKLVLSKNIYKLSLLSILLTIGIFSIPQQASAKGFGIEETELTTDMGYGKCYVRKVRKLKIFWITISKEIVEENIVDC